MTTSAGSSRAQRSSSEPVARRFRGRDVVDDEVRGARETVQDLACPRLGRGRARCRACSYSGRGTGRCAPDRAPAGIRSAAARGVASPGGLDLDDVGAQIRELLGGVARRDEVAALDDADAGERIRACRLLMVAKRLRRGSQPVGCASRSSARSGSAIVPSVRPSDRCASRPWSATRGGSANRAMLARGEEADAPGVGERRSRRGLAASSRRGRMPDIPPMDRRSTRTRRSTRRSPRSGKHVRRHACSTACEAVARLWHARCFASVSPVESPAARVSSRASSRARHPGRRTTTTPRTTRSRPGRDGLAAVVAEFGARCCSPTGTSIGRSSAGSCSPTTPAPSPHGDHLPVHRAAASSNASSDAERSGAPMVVYESALLVENGRPTVAAPDRRGCLDGAAARAPVRAQRAHARRSGGAIRSQMPLAREGPLADYVIDNSGTPEARPNDASTRVYGASALAWPSAERGSARRRRTSGSSSPLACISRTMSQPPTNLPSM